jgi:hypothetical protein
MLRILGCYIGIWGNLPQSLQNVHIINEVSESIQLLTPLLVA